MKNCAIINCKICEHEGHYCFICNDHTKFNIVPSVNVKKKSDLDKQLGNFRACFGNNNTKIYLAEYTVLMTTPIVNLHDGTFRLIVWDENEIRIWHEHGNELDDFIKDGGFSLVYDGSYKD
jgi:hypothetical protein